MEREIENFIAFIRKENWEFNKSALTDMFVVSGYNRHEVEEYIKDIS